MADKSIQVVDHNTGEFYDLRLKDNGDGTYSIASTAVLAGDVEIGAVEIKDEDSDDRAIVSPTTGLYVDVRSIVNPVLATGSNLVGKIQPAWAIVEGGITELIGADEQVAQNQFSADATIALGVSMSGEIIGVLLEMHHSAGALLNETGFLYFFDADPGLSAADTGFSSTANAQKALGGVAIAAADWSPASGNYITCPKAVAIPFHALSDLFVAYFHSGATQYNSAGGDDEVLSMNVWIRRDS